MATAPTLLEPFKVSYESFMSYPENLIYKPTCKAILEEYKRRLDEASSTLFIGEDEEANVPFRFEKRNIFNDSKLKEWIEDQSPVDSLTARHREEAAAKADPKCRFIFIHAADNSRQHLRITRKMILRILSYHQVMPDYLDFLFPFGLQSVPRDFRFSAFREQTLLKSPARGPAVPGLRRSGRQIQLSFNLKGVHCSSGAEVPTRDKIWSPRQAAVHHQFDMELGTTLWILTKGNLELKERIQDMTIHLLLCQWSCGDWRWYILWLEDAITYETWHVNLPRSDREVRYEYRPKDFQGIQHYEDLASQVAMVLEANSYVLESLCAYYRGLLDGSEWRVTDLCRGEILSFCSQIDNMIQNVRMEIVRVKTLVQIASSNKALVLQHIQSQATEKMEELTMSMHQVGDLSRKEAIAMRIVTVVTLIYLPATFVSVMLPHSFLRAPTLFSTDIVKYQDQGNGGTKDSLGNAYVSFSSMALARWIEVTIPLTILTLALGYYAFKRADKKRKRFAILPTNSMDTKESMV
ncbi:hypothetical protein V494_04414 [Pseudogymnoascus sp. VKM F-4513 (FW-928)]|nr:hypothetical protein V494_04414 [Pseudogymnoascus sp. VKM F-4513 (FW-928)]